MMSRAVRLASILLLALLLSACGGQAPGAGSGGNDLAYTELNYEELKIEEAPEAVRTWAAGYLENPEPQEARFEHEGKTYILVTFGEKSTAGYEVEIIRVADSEGQLEVVAELTAPAPDAVVAQVITYPAAFVRIDETAPEGLQVLRQGEDAARDGARVEDPPLPPFWHPATSNDLVEGVTEWVDGLKQTQGVFHRNFEGKTYVLVAWGEKTTGGYLVDVRDARHEGERLILDVALTAPKEGERVTEAVSYPYDLIVVQHPGPFVYEVAFEGAPVGSEAMENQAFRLTAPAPHAVVNSGFVLEGEARVFEATFQAVLEDGHVVLWEKTIMASEGAPEWGDFAEEVEFEPPTSPFGTLRVFEYSAKDGSVVNELVIPVQFGSWMTK